LVFGEVDELWQLISQAEVMKPESGSKPVVKHIALPKPFIAGEVYSPKEDACIEGAKVILTNIVTGQGTTALTDNYGDFWIQELQDDAYSLTIEKDGYYPKRIKNLKVKDGLNLGPIKLYRRSSSV
jgi:hypothetical protein